MREEERTMLIKDGGQGVVEMGVDVVAVTRWCQAARRRGGGGGGGRGHWRAIRVLPFWVVNGQCRCWRTVGAHMVGVCLDKTTTTDRQQTHRLGHAFGN